MNINGENAVLGRLASKTAKKLLEGEKVGIINAGKIIITGNPETTLMKYIERRQRGSAHHGPFFPKTPVGIVHRAVRGMLPKTKKGREAMKKLRVYVSGSKEVTDAKPFSSEISSKYITVEELSRKLGWKE